MIRRVVFIAVATVLGLVVAAVVLLVANALELLPLPRPVPAGDVDEARSAREGQRVLFVGNSFTFANEMPSMVRQLAATDGDDDPVFLVQYTAGNWSFRRFARDDALADLLAEVPWDLVVLQERSWVPALAEDERAQRMYAFAHDLHRTITAGGADTVLFETWAYRTGMDDDTYAGMQERVSEGYGRLAGELGAEVAPVGQAWAEALRRKPTLELWSADGRHPGPLGSYLAANVVYATLFDSDPRRTQFTADLPADDVALLQAVATAVTAARK